MGWEMLPEALVLSFRHAASCRHRRLIHLVCAVVPIKAFFEAKTRLSPKLGPHHRAAFFAVSAQRVLRALAESPLLDLRLAVVDDDDDAADLARQHGFEVVRRPQVASQSAAVSAGFDVGRRRGAETLLTISADIPLASPEDVARLLRDPGPVAVMVSDRAGKGTNALRLTPAAEMSFSFGPGSLSIHRHNAEQLGLKVEVLDLPHLRLDIDTPEDLDILYSTPVGRRVLIEAGQLELRRTEQDLLDSGPVPKRVRPRVRAGE
jgi:2-phospho-L-lactate guanylyltransferase